MDKKNIGKRIRYAREERGLTQAQLAEKLHLSENYIGLIERNVNTPSLTVIMSIANELGISLDYLASTHLNDNCSECNIYREAIIDELKSFNKMQLLLILDLLNIIKKYNWNDIEILQDTVDK